MPRCDVDEDAVDDLIAKAKYIAKVCNIWTDTFPVVTVSYCTILDLPVPTGQMRVLWNGVQ